MENLKQQYEHWLQCKVDESARFVKDFNKYRKRQVSQTHCLPPTIRLPPTNPLRTTHHVPPTTHHLPQHTTHHPPCTTHPR